MDFFGTQAFAILASFIGVLGVLAFIPWLKIEIDFLLQSAPEEFKHPSVEIVVRAANLGFMPLTGHLLLDRNLENVNGPISFQLKGKDKIELTLLGRIWKKCKLTRSSVDEVSLGYMRFLSENDDLMASRTKGGVPPTGPYPEIDLKDIENVIGVVFIPSGIYTFFPRFLLRKRLNFKQEIVNKGRDKILSAGTNPEWTGLNNAKPGQNTTTN